MKSSMIERYTDSENESAPTQFTNSSFRDDNIDEALFITNMSGKVLLERIEEDPLNIHDKIEIRDLPHPIVCKFNDELLEKRMWILTGSEKLNYYMDDLKRYRGKGILCMDKYVLEANPVEILNSYKELLHKMPFILDRDRYGIIVTRISPVKFCPESIQDGLVPALCKEKEEIPILNRTSMTALVESMFSPVTTSAYFRRWTQLSPNIEDKSYHLPIKHYVAHRDFQACSGEEEEVDIYSRTYISQKLEQKMRRFREKTKDAYKKPLRVLNNIERHEKYKLQAKINKKTKKQAFANAIRVDTYDDVYAVALRDLKKLSLGATMAESCSFYEDFVEPNFSKVKEKMLEQVADSVLVDKIVSLIEQIGLLLYTCRQSKSISGIASAIALWLLARYSGERSIILQGQKIMANLLGSAETREFFTHIEGVAESKETEPLGYSDNECMVGPADFSELGEALNGAKYVGHSETMIRLHDFVGIISQIGCCSVFGFEYKPGAMSEGFNRFMFCTRFYDAVVGHVTYFIERIWAAYQDRDPRALLGSDSTADILVKSQDLIYIMKRLNTHTTDIDPVTTNKLEMDIDACIKKLGRAIITATGAAKTPFIRARALLQDAKVDLSQIRDSGENVTQPFAFIVYGTTAQGKSSFMDTTMCSLLSQHCGIVSKCPYQTMISTEKWDQPAPGKAAVCFEEVGSMIPEKMQEAPYIERMLRYINTARTPAMNAVAEKKGNLLPVYKLVTASTNNKTFYADQWMAYPAAVLRRWKIFITITAKPEYMQNGVLASALVPEGVAPWLITLQKLDVVVDQRKLDIHAINYTHKNTMSATTTSFSTLTHNGVLMKDVEYNVAYACISDMFVEHMANEKKLITKLNLVRELGVCEHNVPHAYCTDLACIAVRRLKVESGVLKVENNDTILKKQIEKMERRSFLLRTQAQSCNDDEEKENDDESVEEFRDVWHLFPRKNMKFEDVNRAIREKSLASVSYKTIYKVTKDWLRPIERSQYDCALYLQKWHTKYSGSQGYEYFKKEHSEQHDLLEKWNSLENTAFGGIRAPYKTGDFPKSTYMMDLSVYAHAYRTQDKQDYTDAKKQYELSIARIEYIEWRKRNKCMGFVVDTALDKMGINPNENSFILNNLARGFVRVENQVPIYMIFVFGIGMCVVMPWFLVFFVPMLLVYFTMCVISHIVEKAKLFASLFDPTNVAKMTMVKAKEYVQNRYVRVALGVAGSMILARLAHSMYYAGVEEKEKKKNVSEACGSEVSKPVEIKPGFKDIYQRVTDYSLRDYSLLGPNNTLEQAVSVISNSLYVIRMSSPGTKLVDKIGVTFSDCILTGMFAIVNRHSFATLGATDLKEQMEVEIFQTGNVQPRCRTFIVKDDLEFFGDDFVLVRIQAMVPSHDLFKEGNSLFPEKKLDVPVHCTWLWRDRECKLQREIVKVTPTRVEYEDRRNQQIYSYDGYGFELKEAEKGQCMAVLVSHSSPFMIAGIHTAGRVGFTQALAGRITRGEVVQAIDDYDARHVMCTASVGSFAVDPFEIGLSIAPVTKQACVNFLPVELGISNCQVMGQVPGFVNQRQRYQAPKYTSIGRKMEALRPEYRVQLPTNLSPLGFVQNLKAAAVQTENGRRDAFQWAEDSYFDFVEKNIDGLDSQGENKFSEVVHEIPISSVFNDSVAGYNTVDCTKAAGFGLAGKKRAHMKDPISLEGYDEYIFPKDYLVREVENTFAKCREKEIPSSVHMGSLKRELMAEELCYIPPPFKINYGNKEIEEGEIHVDEVLKKKVRFFAGCSFPFLICCKMMFGMLLRYFTIYSVVFGMALGLNLHSYDFTVLVNSWVLFGSAIIAGDYKKFDKKLNSMVTSSSARVIVRLLAKAGYSKMQLRICSCLLYDVIYPLYLWSGVLLRFAQTTPSGHPLTLFKNNIDNQICMRYCWYRLFQDMGREAPRFDDFVVLNTVGDDHIGTVSPLYPEYNLKSIAHYMLELGMLYTAANKTEIVNLYEDFDEIEYLKMRAKWDSKLKVYMPLLNKASIYKMITKTIGKFQEGSVEMEEHTLEVLKEAFHCMYYYGEAEYLEFCKEVDSCVDSTTFKYVLFKIPSYGEEEEAYKIRLRESNTVRLDTSFVVPTEWE